MSGLLMFVLIGFTAFATDIGLALYNKRQLQAATDAAALAAVENPASSRSVASTILAANLRNPATITALTAGFYEPDSSLSPAQRFTAGGSPVNAVSLSTTMDSPVIFAHSFLPQDLIRVRATAIAASRNDAALVAGSGLAQVDAGLLNAMLGSMLGAHLTLTAVQYQALASTNISALDFLNQAANQEHMTLGTYGSLGNTNITLGQLVAAEAAALQGQGNLTATALTAMQALTLFQSEIPGAPSLTMGRLIDAGIWQGSQIGSANPTSALQAQVNLLQMQSFAAQLANGSNFAAAGNATSIPGVANFDVATTMIEPPQGSYYAVGPTGTTVHTAQVRLQITANLLTALQLGLSSAPVSLPVYVEVADGTASTTAITCGADPSSDTTVSVQAISGVANAYIGSVGGGAMSDFSHTPTVSPATLVDLAGVVKVTGTATASVQGNATPLTFTAQQIAAATPQTVTSTNMTSNLFATLASSTQMSVTAVGVLPLPASVIAGNVATLLQPVSASLDAVIDRSLRTLGVRVGYLDVTVPGARCGVPSLVL